MKNDEFAFFNQQMAAMLRDGIPLEGALHRLCDDMRRGKVRDELQALEADLARGTPMAEALPPRRLPELYKRMVLIGVKSGDLPGALTMLADYFQRQNDIRTRLKSMMTYPLIVMFIGFAVSALIACLWSFVIGPSFRGLFGGMGFKLPWATIFALDMMQVVWVFPVVLGIIFVTAVVVLFQPAVRGRFLWRFPAFKEATISRVASAMILLLKNGVNFPDAVGLVEELEGTNATAEDLRWWKRKLAGGATKFSEIAVGNKVFPPMFIWIVASAGEDLVAGLNRAAEIYHSRALCRTEVALFSILPIASIFLGVIVISQAFFLISMFLPMVSMICNMS